MLEISINPTTHKSLADFIQYLLNYAISTSVILVVVALIISGFKYMLAMGDEEKVKKATKSLTFALVGLVLVFIAPMLVKYIIISILQ
ncbi:TPA: hypothetical protein DEP90_00210 [Patescibacteria group bacterium]|nr:hypothetical protein [Patescibacteria group bacterium]